MGSPESKRKPCPVRILHDIAGGFAMGAVGASAFHSLKGGTEAAVGMHAARAGGQFAVWAGVFSACDCTLASVRRKEDPWNSIISGAATAGILSMRRGLVPATRSAVMGGLVMAMIEAAKMKLKISIKPVEDATPTPKTTTSSTAWFAEEEVIPSAQTEVLEAFDSPMFPTFDDEFK